MATKPIAFSFPVYSFRNIETPFQKQGVRDYLAIVHVDDLPDLSAWRDLNVRDPKLTGSVPKKIRAGFSEQDMFLFMNRGLVIAVDSAQFDNKNSKLTITMKDPKVHGLLDGGHSYKIIMDERDEIDFDQYVKIEFLEGFDHDAITDVVDARNTSNQVKDESLLNLEGAFEPLKKVLEDEFFYDDIAFMEYEVYEDGEQKLLDIREVIAILTAFDRENFDDTNHPVMSYSSKALCLKHFASNLKAYKRLYPLAGDLLRLYDAIQLKLPDLYNSTGGKFGNLTGVYKRDIHLHYLDEDTNVVVPDGFIYPILAAFRALLVIDKDGSYAWGTGKDPIDLLDSKLGADLARTVGNYALQQQNPTKTGKFGPVWQSCYQAVEIYHLKAKK